MEDLKYHIITKSDNVIVSNIDKTQVKDIIGYIEKENELIKYEGIQFRVGKLINDKFIIYGVSSDKKMIRSSRSFKTNLNIIASSCENLAVIKTQVEGQVYKEVNMLIHNLTTLNAHNMQEIFNFIPQNDLSKVKNTKKLILEKVKENPTDTTLVLMKLLKNNISTKTEFSVFSKLYEDNPELDFQNMDVKRVLMNTIYNFFIDLTDKKIELDIEEVSYKANFDYESVQVAFFHMIDNTIKYIKSDSQLTIRFDDLINQVDIIFDMISLKVNENEKDIIFNNGYSGECARENGKSGKGIGMARVKQILELNNGSIELSKSLPLDKDSNYSNNIFKISIKKEGYYR